MINEVRIGELENLLKIDNWKLKIFLIILISFILNLKSAPAVHAQSMSNNQYIIRQGSFNPNNKTSSEVNQAEPSPTPIEDVASGIPFRFSISTNLIDFGIMNPTTPVLRTNKLSIFPGSTNNYEVLVSQDHNLKITGSGQEVPPTSCDDGSCTPDIASVWQSSLTYGLGFRCDNLTGVDCSTDFADTNDFKPFVSTPSASVIMTGITNNLKISQVTYKVNFSNAQPAGIYTNVIKYIAVPSF